MAKKHKIPNRKDVNRDVADRNIKQVVNFGCSFAYGNRASETNVLSDEHRSAATGIAQRLGVPEVNLARPGNSNEGILDNIIHWISTSNRDTLDTSLLLIGWTNGRRFGYVSDSTQASNKPRPGKHENEVAMNAFVLGPDNLYRYQIDKWNEQPRWKNINLEETSRLSLYRNVIAAYSLIDRYGLMAVQYHGLIPPPYPYLAEMRINEYTVLNDMRTLITKDKFYKFEGMSLQWQTNQSPDRYYVAPEDSHPNHASYRDWDDRLWYFMQENKMWGWKYPTA